MFTRPHWVKVITRSCSLTMFVTRKKCTKTESRFNYGKSHYDNLRKTVREQDFVSVLEGKNTAEAWVCIKDILDNAMNDCIPKCCTSTSPKNRKPVWWNKKASAKIKKKRRAYQR